jgi:hypothetical protein
MISTRKPGVVVENPKADCRKTDQIKTHWRKACSGLSLKAFARQASLGGVDVAKDAASRWLGNKKVNTSNPPKGIGRTNRISKKGGK